MPDRTIVAMTADMRLTTADLARLTPEQVRAVFEGIGGLTAILHGRADTEPTKENPDA